MFGYESAVTLITCYPLITLTYNKCNTEQENINSTNTVTITKNFMKDNGPVGVEVFVGSQAAAAPASLTKNLHKNSPDMKKGNLFFITE